MDEKSHSGIDAFFRFPIILLQYIAFSDHCFDKSTFLFSKKNHAKKPTN